MAVFPKMIFCLLIFVVVASALPQLLAMIVATIPWYGWVMAASLGAFYIYKKFK